MKESLLSAKKRGPEKARQIRERFYFSLEKGDLTYTYGVNLTPTRSHRGAGASGEGCLAAPAGDLSHSV